MTGGRREIRARLAAALDDARAIESRPIDEVRTALSDLGIDPVASIRLAQRLASSGGNDPAARLLSKIEHAEAVDAEIAALEEADIDDVKAALSAKTDSPRRSDRSSSAEIVPIEPRRRRLSALGWGSSLIGIAASVLLFIAVRPDRLEEADVETPSMEAPAPLAEKVESADAASGAALLSAEVIAPNPLPELSQLQGKASAGRDRDTSEQVDLADALEEALVTGAGRRAPLSLDEQAGPTLAESRKRGLGEDNRLDRSSEVTASNTEVLESPPRPMPRPDLSDREHGEMVAAAPSPSPALLQDPPIPAPRLDLVDDESVETAIAASRPQPTLAADVASLHEPPPAPDVLLTILADLRAVLLVDEASAPISLRALSNRLPEGRLAAMRGEAELRAAGGKVVALIAFARNGEVVDAALVETPAVQTVPDLSAQTVTGFAGFAGSEPSVLLRPEPSFELIELSTGR